jgi:hypothetical protein
VTTRQLGIRDDPTRRADPDIGSVWESNPARKPPGKPEIEGGGGAECGALHVMTAVDPGLQRVIATWHRLPDGVQQTILALIAGVLGEGGG